MQEHQITVTSYDYSNDRLNAIAGWDIVWIVQGPAGRMPVIADTPEDAKKAYVDRKKQSA